MPIILAGFVLLPFLLGAVIQYAVCRFTRRKRWRVLPGLAAAVLALLIAAACAKGESIINSCEVIYRGYEKLTEKLSSLGCDIEEI